MARRKGMFAVAGLAVAAALTLAGCAGGGTDGTETSHDPVTPDTLKFVSAPIVDFAPLWVGLEQGYFKDAGVNVVDAGSAGAQNGAESAALLVSGKFDLGLSTLTSLAQAAGQGIQLKAITGSTVLGGPDDGSNILVTGKSGPTSFKELGRSGVKIGVVALNSPAQVFTMKTIDEAGGDSSAVTFQSVPYPSGAELVANGSIDADVLIEPFATKAKKNPDLTVVGSVGAVLPENTPGLEVVATPAVIKGKAGAIAKFKTGWAQAIKWINDDDNHDALLKLLANKTGQDLDVLAEGSLPTYAEALSEESVKKYLKMMVEYKVLDEIPTLSDILAD